MVSDQLRRRSRISIEGKADRTPKLATFEAAPMVRIRAQLEPERIVRPAFMNIRPDMRTPRGQMRGDAMKAVSQVQLAGRTKHGNRRELLTLFEKIRVLFNSAGVNLQTNVGRRRRP